MKCNKNYKVRTSQIKYDEEVKIISKMGIFVVCIIYTVGNL